MDHSTKQGRLNQKRRTRNAILAAAAEITRYGQIPTVAEAADAAGVSRATAYRYFPAQNRLLIEAALETTTPVIEALINQSSQSVDPAIRLDAVVHAIQTTVIANEGAFRTMLRFALESRAAPVPSEQETDQPRGARRIRWIENALAPISPQLPLHQQARLVAALALCVGIESIVVLRDICDLDPDEAEAVTRWAAQTLLRAVLLEANHV